ncbi:MAG TPA: ABC transporter permease [Streptosporangiaceae bacterium]|jgi:simple sugar transport system permease protein
MTERGGPLASPQGGMNGGNGGGPGLLRQGLSVFSRQREATVLIVTVALLLYFGLTHASTFLSNTNAVDLLSENAAPIAIIGIGEVLLLICGEIDLSVGFIATFAPFVMYFLITYDHVPALLAIILSLLVGLIVGWINGFITVTLRVPSFITTLGTGFVLLGLVDTTSHAEPVNIPASSAGLGSWIGSDGWAQIIWAVALVLIFHIVLTRTRWGLHTVAVGGNRLGAQEAGINVGRIKYGNFMITGVLGALVGLQTAFYTNTIDPLSGGYTPMFYSVTAAVIGGTAMLGGSGTILGAFLGALALSTLIDGFNIIGISANPLPIIFGGAILVAMIANVQLARLREAGRAR